MKKWFKVCISLGLVLIILISGILIYYRDNKNTITYQYNNNLSQNLSFISNTAVNNTLSKCYYESKDFAGFSSATMTSTPNIYLIDWTLSIMKKFDFSNDAYLGIKSCYESIDINKIQYEELEKLRLISSINKSLNISNYNKAETLILLMKHYNDDDSLFYWKDKNEDISNKLLATCIILQILGNLDINIGQREKIKLKLLDLYSKDEYFTYGDIKSNLIDKGGCIIKSLILLGVKYNNSIKNREDWITYYNDEVYDIVSFDPFSLEILKELISLNNFFGKELPKNPKFMEKLFKEKQSFEGLGYGNNSFNVDPHYIDVLLEISSYNNFEFPFKVELFKYINDSIISKFVKFGDCKIAISDNYYGIVLANKFGFIYDKIKVFNFLNSWYTKNIEENSGINSTDKLVDLYYLLLSYNEFQVKIENDGEIIYSVNNFLNNIEYTSESVLKDITYIKIGLDIINMLNEKPSNNVKEKLKTLLNNISEDDKFYTNITVTDIYEINQYINCNAKAKINTKILENLEKLKLDGGYKFRQINNNEYIGEPDIISTSKAIKVKNNLIGITFEDKIQLNDFISNLKSNENIFKVSENSQTTDLRIIYEGCKILYMIGE